MHGAQPRWLQVSLSRSCLWLSIFLQPCLLLPSFWLFGQTAAASDANRFFEMSLEELMSIKVEVASRSEQTLLEAPSSVSRFTRAEIDALGARTLSDLLAYVPGLRGYRTAGITIGYVDMYEARGVPTNASSQILVLRDGQRLNSTVSGSGVGNNSMFHPLAGIDRVEIIRGPGSALYGSNAFLAVINLISRERENSAQAGVGTQDERHAALDWHHDWDNWRMQAHVGWQRDDGEDYSPVIDPAGLDTSTQDPMRSRELHWRLANAHWRIELYDLAQRADDFYVYGYLADGFAWRQTHFQSLSAVYNTEFSDDWQASLLLGGSRSTVKDQFLGAPQVPPFVFADFRGGAKTKTDESRIELALKGIVDQHHQLNAGLEWRRENLPEDSIYANYDVFTLAYLGGIVSQPQNTVFDGEDRSILGAYIQDEYRITESLVAFLGLRSDHYSTGGSPLSPRAALIWQMSKQDSLKLLYGSAFRAPSLNELYARNIVIQGNPDLEAMTIKTAELGYYHSDANLHFSATLFAQTLDDRIANVPFGTRTQRKENTGSLDNSGIELEGAWQFDTKQQLRMNFTRILDTEEDMGLAANTLPAEQATPRQYGSLAYIHSNEAWQWTLSARYTGTMPQDPRLQSHTLWDFSGRYQLTEPIGVQLAIRNLTDKEYFTVSGEGGLGRGPGAPQPIYSIPQRGREAWVSLIWTF